MTDTAGGRPAAREHAYHHGDLAAALTDAATALARTGGPDAIVLREAARNVGVSATAAYRHFAGHADLVLAVKHRALGELADTMEKLLAEVTPSGDPVRDAEAELAATGRAYLQFALAEPGLFRVAFDSRGLESDDLEPGATAAYQRLSLAMDRLAACGRIPPDRREQAETAAWAAVHGLALLLLDGPLHGLPDDAREQAVDRTIDMVLRGI